MKKRLINGIIYLAIICTGVFLGKMIFLAMMLLFAIIALNELIDAYDKKKRIPLVVQTTSYLGLITLILFNTHLKGIALNFSVFPLLILVCLLLLLTLFNNKNYTINDSFFLISIILLLGFSFSYLISIRETGLARITYIFAIAMATDTFAYIGGNLIGRKKLTNISPNKTVEGSLVGALFGTLIGSGVYFFTIGDVSLTMTIVISVVLSIMAQLGDLFFSLYKREFKIKDFSDLIEGHGGIVDRFDSIIFVVLSYIIINHLI